MKKYAWLIYIISCFFIGFLFTYLVYIGLWTRLMDGFRSIPIWLYILWLPVVFYVTLTMHELGHLIAFRIQGVKIRALYLTIFVFYKNDKGWHFTIKPKLWVLFGGMVIPDLPQIKSDEDMDHITHVFARSLIAAPYVTISVMILSVMSFLLVWIFGSGSFCFGLLTIFMMYTVLLSSLYIYTFKLNTKHLYGDFVAYKKIKEDPLFRFAEIYQYQSFSLDVDDNVTYLYEHAKRLIESQDKLKHHLFMIMTLMAYLEGVMHHELSPSTIIDEKLSTLPVRSLASTEEGLTLLYMLAEYHYHQQRVDIAYAFVEKAQKHAGKKLPELLKNYLYKRTEHVLHIAYHDAFLSLDENLYIGQAWLFEAIEDPYDILRKTHEQLPFQVYVCDIPVDNISGYDIKKDVNDDI